MQVEAWFSGLGEQADAGHEACPLDKASVVSEGPELEAGLDVGADIREIVGLLHGRLDVQWKGWNRGIGPGISWRHTGAGRELLGVSLAGRYGS